MRQAALAEVLVTGNRRDFPETTYGVTEVVGAGELLQRLAANIR